jgi:diguanylate cyclase (GGDEF)-like protein
MTGRPRAGHAPGRSETRAGTRAEIGSGTGLVARFAAISLVLLAGLGVLLGVQLHRMIETRARSEAQRMGTIATHLVLSVITTSNAAEPAAQAQQLTAIATALRDPGVANDVLAATAWTADGTVAFSSSEPMGRRVALDPNARLAVSGQSSSRVVRPGDPSAGPLVAAHGSILEIYFPLRIGGSGQVMGAVQMVLPYQPVEQAIARDTSTMIVLLVVVLTVLWLVLFRLVSTASRRLREQAAENRHMALHDTLTGLPNRTLLLDRAGQALAAAGRSGLAVAILMLDLDRFKEINDTLGHRYGDGLLTIVAQRLQEILRDTDTAVRLGGDEFAVLAVDLAGPEEARQVAERVQAALHQPFVVNDVTLDIEASVGVAIAPTHGTDIDSLLRCADVAMYVAKVSRSGIEVYDSLHDQHTPERLALLGDLRRALEQPGQLSLHYQPKLSIDGVTVAGVEALIRWAHPTRGQISPVEFIPVAEGTGLIHPLTAFTLELALRQARTWSDAGHAIPVAVNISTRCLLDLGLPDKIAGLLQEHGVPAELLRLEITESTLMADPSRAMTVLTRLADQGIRLSIDDFGTGFSSMSYLKRLPVDELKVDRSFVKDMTTQAADHVLVRSVVELGHNLGLHVVAEGVETADTLRALADLGCDVAQGYLLGRPMPADEIDAWLSAHGTAATAAAGRQAG